jgi:hypothetical protein
MDIFTRMFGFGTSERGIRRSISVRINCSDANGVFANRSAMQNKRCVKFSPLFQRSFANETELFPLFFPSKFSILLFSPEQSAWALYSRRQQIRPILLEKTVIFIYLPWWAYYSYITPRRNKRGKTVMQNTVLLKIVRTQKWEIVEFFEEFFLKQGSPNLVALDALDALKKKLDA